MFKKLLLGLTFLILFSYSNQFANGYCVACECTFENYKKPFWGDKVYEVNRCYGDVELKDADYDTFEYFDWYARDKNNIYTYGEKRYDRIVLNSDFTKIYKEFFYKNNNKVYFKNKKGDLFEVFPFDENFKVIYDGDKYLFVRNSELFFKIDKTSYWNKTKERYVNSEYGCNISKLEYSNGTFYDNNNVCGYNNVFPIKYLNIINSKLNGFIGKNYRKRSYKVSNFMRNTRKRFYDEIYNIEDKARVIYNNFDFSKLSTSDIKELNLKRQLLGITEYMKEKVMCNPKNNIDCADLFRRQNSSIKPHKY